VLSFLRAICWPCSDDFFTADLTDEVGLAIAHSDAPNCHMIPFLYAPTQTAYCLLWPSGIVPKGVVATRDFLPAPAAPKSATVTAALAEVTAKPAAPSGDNSPGERYTGPESLWYTDTPMEIISSPNKGRGLYTKAAVQKGQTLLKTFPYVGHSLCICVIFSVRCLLHHPSYLILCSIGMVRH
jgi:hypothetical protein